MQSDDDGLGPTVNVGGATAPAESWPSANTDAAGGAGLQRYKLENVIGRGGMGEVVSARDEQIGRSVAIKRMRDADVSPEARARFIREAQIQGRLEHPAIVPVHELWRDDHGRPFFVMKQLAGVTLYDVLGMLLVEDPETIAKYTRQRLLRAFTEVCLAVEFAHTRGVVHRDLKPANIMLGDFGECYILDWGIARVLAESERASFAPVGEISPDDSTVVGTMMGTPGYMSPEQIRGDADLDGRADVYALGCILFEILAGESLHERGKRPLVEKVAAVDPRPSARAPDREIPPELDAACAAACAPERDKRIGSARELGDLVQAYLDGDRDVALRQTLARAELAIANAALEGGLLASLEQSRREQRPGANRDVIEVYKNAVRAAARAVALDPKSREAAELLARLMLEPPAEIPPEVDDALAEYEKQQIASHARLGVRALLGYVIFFPVIYLGGIRDLWLVVGGAALTFGIMGIVHLISKRVTLPLVYASFVGNALLIVLYARGLTPLLVAPGVALITVMIYASHPRLGRLSILWALCAAGVLVPLGLEAIGALATTTSVEGATLKMTLPAERLDPTIAIGGLAAYVAVILAIAALIARLQALHQRQMQRAIQLQAWQLKQLVPASR